MAIYYGPGSHKHLFRTYELTGGTTTDSTKDILDLDNNWFYEIIYTSMHYDIGQSTAGWRYVRWHAYDGSGGAGENAGVNWYITVVENTGTGESNHTPGWTVVSGKARITYGSGYMSYRGLTVRGFPGDGIDRTID